MKKLLSLLALSLAFAVPVASALSTEDAKTCKTLAESFGPAKTALEAKLAERDGLATEAEAAGEAWENAENVRTLSQEAAAQADALRVVFDEKKAAFEVVEADLSERSQKLNADFARFNKLCVKD